MTAPVRPLGPAEQEDTVTVTLITGANKGIGYETARRLVSLGHRVWVGARDVARGERAADALGARAVQLDVTDDASVAAALATVAEVDGHLDVLVNNAGKEGAEVVVRLATLGPDGPTGTLQEDDTELQW